MGSLIVQERSASIGVGGGGGEWDFYMYLLRLLCANWIRLDHISVLYIHGVYS